MPDYWERLLYAFLHDPPDKAHRIAGHEERSSGNLSILLDEPIEPGEMDKYYRKADITSASLERLCLPNPRFDSSCNVMPKEGGKLTVSHPLSGTSRTITVDSLDIEWIKFHLQQLREIGESSRIKFLATWRFLQERLIKERPNYAYLPADTRVPDHTTWNHLDTAAGLTAAYGNNANPAFLYFHLGPVQSFIRSSRSLMDLWAGSYILSWLSFRAMLPIIEELGPSAIFFPSLRTNPFLDKWLKDQQLPIPDTVLTSSSEKTIAFLPNRFLAVIPDIKGKDTTSEFARKCEMSALEGWRGLAGIVRNNLGKRHPWSDEAEWDTLWDQQVDSFFEFRATIFPWYRIASTTIRQLLTSKRKPTWSETDKSVHSARELGRLIKGNKGYSMRSSQVGFWQTRVELIRRLMEAERLVAHTSLSVSHDISKPTPPKCSIFGTLEQMGPAKLDASDIFWQKLGKTDNDGFNIGGTHIREHDRLSAVALVKRFARACFFSQSGYEFKTLRYPDTATIAAAKWLDSADINPETIWQETGDWNGQWLHWNPIDLKEGRKSKEVLVEMPPSDGLAEKIMRCRNTKECGWPPRYYAILMMDGDNMGKWLWGKQGPTLRQAYHPKPRQYFERLKGGADLLEDIRPVTPARHAAISQALANFSLQAAPFIIEKHSGFLIYAGGDDLLAVLPLETALPAARELSLAFRGDPEINGEAAKGYYRRTPDDPEMLMMGPTASISGGMAVVHYKEDLRLALDEARDALKEAKRQGRNALTLSIWRRSGQHTRCLCEWEDLRLAEALRLGFVDKKISDRWLYALMNDLPVLENLPQGAALSEIRRRVFRMEKDSRNELLLRLQELGSSQKDAEHGVEEQVEEFIARRNKRRRKSSSSPPTNSDLHDFLTLCQSASFFARGDKS